jgi:hypothetical protein
MWWNGESEIGSIAISGITQGPAAVVTSSYAGPLNPFLNSFNVVLSGVSGMTQINGQIGTITAVGGSAGAWTATVNINSSSFSVYTSGGTASPSTDARSGGLMIHSAYSGQKDIVFEGNSVYAIGRPGLVTAQLQNGAPYDIGTVIKGGTIVSDSNLLNVNCAPGLILKDIEFHGLSGAETADNLIKNMFGGLVEGCTFRYDTTPSANYALRWYTDGGVSSAGGAPTVRNCSFYNCGDFAFFHDPFTYAVPAMLSGNLFTLTTNGAPAFTAAGGMNVTNVASPVYVDQKLFLEFSGALTLSTVPALGAVSKSIVAHGRLLCVDRTTLQNNYDFAFANGTVTSRDGSGASSGQLASATYYATFATGTITPSSGTTCYAELDLTSWR